MSGYQQFEVTVQQQKIYGDPRAPTLRLGRTWKTVVNAENYFMAKDVAQRMFPGDRIVTAIALPTSCKSNGANTLSAPREDAELAHPVIRRIVGAILCFVIIATIVGRIASPSPDNNRTSQPLDQGNDPVTIPKLDPNMTGRIMPPQGPGTLGPAR